MTHHSPIIPAARSIDQSDLQPDPQPDPQPGKAPTALPAVRHDGWTLERQTGFLRELAACHCVSTAARAVGMSRQSAYALRARLKGEPFDMAWTAALLCRFDVLAEALVDRAINGIEVPHFYRGELVGTSRKYDDRAAVALLALRGRFAPRRFDPASDEPQERYGVEEFGALLERVGDGPETWTEEQFREEDAERLAQAERLAELEAMGDDNEEGEES